MTTTHLLGSLTSLFADAAAAFGYMSGRRKTMAETDSRKTIVLTGASRGIGHATVKRFSREGWRVITCSRQAFAEDCPWPAGPEDHIKVDLADQEDVGIAVSVVQEAGTVVIANNLIADTPSGAIVGREWDKTVTGDLSKEGAERYVQLSIDGNRVR